MTDQQFSHDNQDQQPTVKRERKQKSKMRGHGEGSIFERKSDRGSRTKPWVAQITLENQRKKTVGYFKTRQEAQLALRKALNDLEQGTFITEKDQTVREYMEHWLEYIHKPTIRLTTYILYRRILAKHILPSLGGIALRRLRPEHIDHLYAEKRAANLAPKTISNIHKLLNTALNDAVGRNKLARNVLTMVKSPRALSAERPVFAPEQATHLLEALRNHRFEVLVIMALVTGMREGELLALRWQDIDFQQGKLQVTRTVTYKAKYGFIITEPKSAKGKRSIALPAFLLGLLKKHRIAHQEMRLKAGEQWKHEDLVFCTQQGNFLTDTFLRERYYRILEQAQLPRIHFHDLRHSTASILLAMGVNIKVVQELLGHSHVTITLGIYGHVLPGMQEDAMRKMGDLLGGNQGE